MEGIIIAALAIFLLTSAGSRDTHQEKRPVAADPARRNVQTVFKYKSAGGYVYTDPGRIRVFIRKFKPKYPDHQVDTYANLIIKHGKVYNVDPKLLAALIGRESAFDPKAVSSTGALGLGQIKPFNFNSLGITNAYDPEQNIRGIAIMLRDLMNKWAEHEKQVEMSLASYKEGYYGVKKKGKYSVDSALYIEDILKYRRELS